MMDGSLDDGKVEVELEGRREDGIFGESDEAGLALGESSEGNRQNQQKEIFRRKK